MSDFRPIKRDMNYLFPPSMKDWLPERHLARFVVDIVEQLDLKGWNVPTGEQEAPRSTLHCSCLS